MLLTSRLYTHEDSAVNHDVTSPFYSIKSLIMTEIIRNLHLQIGQKATVFVKNVFSFVCLMSHLLMWPSMLEQ